MNISTNHLVIIVLILVGIALIIRIKWPETSETFSTVNYMDENTDRYRQYIMDIASNIITTKNVHDASERLIDVSMPCDHTKFQLLTNNVNNWVCIYPSKIKGPPMNNPDYKFAYTLRDLLTTVYMRSFEYKGNHINEDEAKMFSINLVYTFNERAKSFVQIYNHINNTNYPDDCFRVLYKGGNTIAMYTRYLVFKLRNGIKNVAGRKFLESKFDELKRGDWDYAMYISVNDPRFCEACRSFVIFLLQEIKGVFDTTRIFNLDTISKKIKEDLFDSGEIGRILNEYLKNTGKTVIVDNIKIPGFIINSAGIKHDPNYQVSVKSKLSVPRSSSSIMDVFPNDTLIDSVNTGMYSMNTTGVSIGLIEHIHSVGIMADTDFDLARLKFNNIATLRMDGESYEKTLSADIIDMSFINDEDTKQDFIYSQLDRNGLKKMTVRKVAGKLVPYYTPHLLFFDLIDILLTNSVYIWNDKKYNKRLDRLIVIGLVSSLVTYGMTTTERMIRAAIDIFVMIKNASNLDTAYSLIANKFSFSENHQDIVYNFQTNYYTNCLLTIVFRVLIINRWKKETINQEEQQYLDTVWVNLFNRSSNIADTNDIFKKDIDTIEYNKLLDFIVGSLSKFSDILVEVRNNKGDIQFSDSDQLELGSI